MSPAPAARKSGVDFRHPGGKEALIAGGVALGLGLLYMWWKNRQSAAAATAAAPAAADTTPSAASTSPTGLLTAWFHDHAGTTTTTTAGSTTTTTTGGSTGSATGTVPDVTGKRVNTAIAELRAAGFGYKSGSGSRNPNHTYVVSGQSPAGGASAAPGSTVTLDFRQGT
jgi:hypothetical protein